MDNEYFKSKLEWSPSQFADEIVRLAKLEPRALEKFPTRIDLENSAFAKICDEMIDETLADPRKRERMRYAVVTFDDDIRISHESIVGSEHGVTGGVNVLRRFSDHGAKYNRTEQVVFNIHTHGAIDMPPSALDLSNLLLDPEEGGMMAEIIVTPSSRFLIMRSLQTEPLNEAEMREFSKKETRKILGDRDMSKVGAIADLDLVATAKQNMQAVLDMCRDYKLKLYFAVGTSNNFVEVKS